MSIAAANCVPNFLLRRQIGLPDLPRIVEPCVVFEYEGFDSDGVPHWVYTIGGWLDGMPLGDRRGGVTVKGEVIVIHALNREHADFLAGDGLASTIDAEVASTRRELDAKRALVRLASISPVERIDQATKRDSDKSSDFMDDIDRVRPLIGDDVILAAGRVTH